MPNDNLTVKQQREQRRQEKVAALKAKQAAERRRNRLGIIGAVVGGVAVIGLVVSLVIVNAQPQVDPETIEIAGVEEFEGLESSHVQGVVDYEMTPPAGGPHNQVWLNCGVYEQPVQNENVVHSLEHSAVWVTYDPSVLSEAEIETLRDAVPSTYMIVSPFEGLESPVVASAWGVQVALDGVEDERLDDFITKYRQSPNAPEPGALCSQGVDGEGLIS